jgi:hypothetical protein
MLDAVNYAITGPASFAKKGTIDVSQSTTLTATIGPIPAGRGYTIALSGDAVGGTLSCAGSAAWTERSLSDGEVARIPT